MNPVVLILPLCALVVTTVSAQPRQWTDDRGRTMKAELLHADGTSARFLKEGREVRWPIAKLSTADQRYIVRWRTKNSELTLGQQDDAPVAQLPEAFNLVSSSDEEDETIAWRVNAA